jgi:hypothetical protein
MMDCSKNTGAQSVGDNSLQTNLKNQKNNRNYSVLYVEEALMLPISSQGVSESDAMLITILIQKNDATTVTIYLEALIMMEITSSKINSSSLIIRWMVLTCL